MQLLKIIHTFTIPTLMLLLAGCSPELTYDGKNTVIGNVEKIKSCRLLGNTRILLPKTVAKVLNQEEIAIRLQIDARNFAGRIGADTVIPVDKIKEASQVFKLYFCNHQSLKNISDN